MLAFFYENLRSSEQEAIWKDDNQWVAQEKLNGCRLILHFIKGVGTFAHSRTVSKETHRRHSLGGHLLFSDLVSDFTATVDAEAIIDKPIDTKPYTSSGGITRSSLHSTAAVFHMGCEASKRLQVEQSAPIIVHAFDITNWQGTDLKRKPLCERLSYLADFRAAINLAQLDSWFAFPPIIFQDKKTFYDKVVSEGGEGVVLKNLNSCYEDSSSRRRDAWIKVKRQVEFDAFLSGFERGKPGGEWRNKVGCLIFSVKTERGDHPIAKVTNFPFVIRKRVSLYNQATNTVELSPNAYGRVATVSGFEIAQRSYRLSHPRILRWRGDLTQDQCVYGWDSIENGGWGKGISPLRIVRDCGV